MENRWDLPDRFYIKPRHTLKKGLPRPFFSVWQSFGGIHYLAQLLLILELQQV